jgi:hypothetical protein
MNPSNSIIVISRYKKDIKWAKSFTDKGYVTLVYDHDESAQSNPYSLNLNKGKEASAYLKYIIDKYDSLPLYSLFIHDKDTSWHHQGSIVKLILDNQGSTKKYYNFNNRVCSTIKNGVWKEMKSFYNKFLSKYLGPIEYFGDWTVNHLCCAQFVVHKSKIRQHPKKFYQDLFNWITTTNMDHEITGRLLEWTWRIIFLPEKYKLEKPINIDDASQYVFNKSVLKSNAV